jgi:hypothetical protein
MFEVVSGKEPIKPLSILPPNHTLIVKMVAGLAEVVN